MWAFWWTLLLLAATPLHSAPIRLHPAYPHIFEYQGKPTQLFATPEHYGAVLNTAFNYSLYLHTLHNDGLNYARTWSGTYRERPGSFGIVNNTLDAPPNHYVAPWKRSTTCCYVDGGNKFDLSQWDPAYFERLKSYIKLAGSLGIIIEFSLFCDYYGHPATFLWSPLYWKNNINKELPHVEHGDDPYLLKNKKYITLLQTLVRKIVTELNDADNLFYEVSNEMWDYKYYPFRKLMLSTILETESKLPKKHLVSDTIAFVGGSKGENFTAKGLDIYNMHNGEAWFVADFLRKLGPKVAVDSDEDAFGPPYERYRYTCYSVLLNGGGAYNNIDYSFQVGYEDGTGTPTFTGGYKGSGGPELRKQIAQCRKFFNQLDIVNMRPAYGDKLVASMEPSVGLNHSASYHLQGKQFAVYLGQSNVYYHTTQREWQVTLQLNIPAWPTKYHIQWINATNGAILNSDAITTVKSGPTTVKSPVWKFDVLLLLSLV
eukprot:TRINITY_DN67796_c4_g4_i8.p1 TRINITY_DN67796_c4_g4~~TRINITY_DN67796_c4_g4_i8.p1  ORF type:complete len:486 (+),score=21.64 TRINITY_DN67796_c4_g4_i8:45-1502(+)